MDLLKMKILYAAVLFFLPGAGKPHVPEGMIMRNAQVCAARLMR